MDNNQSRTRCFHVPEDEEDGVVKSTCTRCREAIEVNPKTYRWRLVSFKKAP